VPKIKHLIDEGARRAVQALVFEQRLTEAGGEVRGMSEDQLLILVRSGDPKIPAAHRIAASRELERRAREYRNMKALDRQMRSNERAF
jgi:hypothetical protein